MRVLRQRQQGERQHRGTAPGAARRLRPEERGGRGGWCWWRDQGPQFPPPDPHPLPSSLFRPGKNRQKTMIIRCCDNEWLIGMLKRDARSPSTLRDEGLKEIRDGVDRLARLIEAWLVRARTKCQPYEFVNTTHVYYIIR
jgi:hypothetical protein